MQGRPMAARAAKNAAKKREQNGRGRLVEAMVLAAE
jgi:hypothetical protein